MKHLAIAAVAATCWLATAPARATADGTRESCRPAARQRVVPQRMSKTALSNAALVQGMNAVRPLILACYERYGVKGLAMVDVRIARSGRVSSAVVTTGTFARTPTGTCVAKAVRSARFPRSDGRSTPYPFQLR
jgi:hypothetical protein